MDHFVKAFAGAALMGGVALAATAPARAHHSAAMFDADHPLTVEGTVQEFRFTAPHSFIILAIKGSDGNTTVWNLEGGSPSTLVREGWSSKSLKPGDELKLTINPLRSGAPGGLWSANATSFVDGRPVVAP